MIMVVLQALTMLLMMVNHSLSMEDASSSSPVPSITLAAPLMYNSFMVFFFNYYIHDHYNNITTTNDGFIRLIDVVLFRRGQTFLIRQDMEV